MQINTTPEETTKLLVFVTFMTLVGLIGFGILDPGTVISLFKAFAAAMR